jgi:molybdopterin-containing oxidoreductase family membrane subunit
MDRAGERIEDVEALGPWRRRLEDTTLAPLRRTSKGYYLLVTALLAIIGWGAYAYSVQLRDGLVVTGMRDRISWGFYITNFVFFIGISHAGTLISAILRVSKANWRTPVTRMAEFITVVALCVGALFPIIDLGRPDRIGNVILYGRWQSPIVWDLVSITTYLTASITYLFLPMIPDVALFRDRLAGRTATWRRRLYQLLSIGWTGSGEQRRLLGGAITVMMILIIPIAVSVHTVVSWIFAMTLRVAWNSTIFGAFFVAGAIFSGIATLIIVMAILRKVYHLEEYITERHFVYLGYLMAAFTLIMIYGNLSEYVTTGYKLEAGEEFHFRQLFLGQFAGFYWYYLVGGMVIPGFNDAVMGMEINEEKQVVLTPDQAYGERRDDMEREFSTEMLGGQKVEVGQMLQFSSPRGPMPAQVLEVAEDKFKVDFNHPLAGKTLVFTIKLAGITDQPTQQSSCGCGCSSSSCGDTCG